MPEKPKHHHTINWIWAALCFSTFYWLIESIRDVFIFDRANLISRIFQPDPMSFWLRILVVCIIMLFGVYAQSLREKMEKQGDSYRIIGSDTMIKAGLSFSVLYWLLESVRDLLLTEGTGIIHAVFLPEPLIFWMRSLAVFILFLFSIYAQALINQRRRVELLLKESEERLEQILHQMPYPIRVSTPDGRTTMVNQAFLNTFQKRSDDDIDQETVFNNQQIMSDSMKESIARAIQGETVFIPKMLFPGDEDKNNTKSVILEATLFPVLKDEEEIWRIVTIWKNITDTKRAEEDKQKIQEQLHQAQKMQAIGILAGGIAHDFNNLLTAILGSTDMILMDHEDDADETLLSDLNEIKRAAFRASDLTRQLLLFSRKAPLGFKPHRVNDSVVGLQKMILRLIGEDIQTDTDLHSDLWTVKADPGTIEQVIMNLAVNARDAMPNGGQLTISTENVTLPDEKCTNIPESRPGQFICLSVADTGCGINQETLPHIFEPFFTTKEPGSGTGLGLSVVYGIIQRHEGWINVYSHNGIGSVFKVYLPAVEEEITIERPRRKHKLPIELQGSGERVLIIEDDENVRNFTIAALQKSGYSVYSAACGKEAEQIYDQEKGDFKLVLSDVVLPDKTGIEVVEGFNIDNPELRVLLFSGYMDDKSRWPVIEEKGIPFIQKPFELPMLLQKIKETIYTESVENN